MRTSEIQVTTGDRPSVHDLTPDVLEFTRGQGDGLVSVFVPHATAGVAIMEMGAGSEVDLMNSIDLLLPPDPRRWTHAHGAPGHGRDHVLPAFVSPSVTLPVKDGRPLLGTWQSVVLVDPNVDNLRRRVVLSFVSG
jgi:secondary thiamine-phosphate synthase enzyme